MFDFFKKKPEDVPSSENAAVTNENKDEEKPFDSSSSSDEEGDENGEKKNVKVCGLNKEDAPDQYETEEKGIMEKIKEKLPAAKGHDQANKHDGDDEKKKKET